MFSWGNGQGGRLGHNQEVGENAPRQITFFKHPVKQIAAGDASSAVITQEGQVYLWGSGLNGRLGNGTSANIMLPELSMELRNYQVLNLMLGTSTSFSILESRSVLAWGSSKNGKLGHPMAMGKNFELPKEVVAVKDLQIF